MYGKDCIFSVDALAYVFPFLPLCCEWPGWYLWWASFSYNWIEALPTARQDLVKLNVLLDCCYLCADSVTAVTTAAACQGLSPWIPSPNYCVYWKLKIYQLMKRGKHYRRCNVINSSLAPISHVRQRRKEVPHISINMNFSQLESTWMKKKIMKKVCFHFLFLFSGSGQKKLYDGRLGTGKAEDADNVVSISLYIAPQLYGCLVWLGFKNWFFNLDRSIIQYFDVDF